MLSSHGWEKVLEADNDLAAIDRLVERFGIPLQSTEANIDAIRDEFAGMIEYSVQYIAIATLDYHSVWWRLFHALPNSVEWPNALVLAELLFSPPASNGKLQQVFFTLGMIKVDKCSHASPTSHWMTCCSCTVLKFQLQTSIMRSLLFCIHYTFIL